MYEFYTDSSKIFRTIITQNGNPVDIRGDQVKMIIKGSGSQEFLADVATQGEQGIAILQCDFNVPPGLYKVEIDYIADNKTYVQQQMEWRCLQRIIV